MSRYKTDPLVMERVRQILYDTGLTNKELGDALGLNANTIGSWLSGRCEISVEGIRRLCEYTGESADWALGLEKGKGDGRLGRGRRKDGGQEEAAGIKLSDVGGEDGPDKVHLVPVRERKYQKRPHRQAGRLVQRLGDVRGRAAGAE